RDPERVDEWSKELSPDVPVAIYCSYGFNVGCAVTGVLRQRGFDARYVQGGLSAWYAAGGERALRRGGWSRRNGPPAALRGQEGIPHGLLHGRDRARRVAPQDSGAQRAGQHARAGTRGGHRGRNATPFAGAGTRGGQVPLLALRGDVTDHLDVRALCAESS